MPEDKDLKLNKDAAERKEMLGSLMGAGDSVLGIAALSGLGAWGGFWLDQRCHTQPWLALTLALVGMGLGLWRMVRKALQAEKK